MTTPPVPSRRDGVNYLYMAAAFVVVAAGMRAAESILNPLLLAIFLSVMCAPPYFAMLKRGVSQWLALLIVTVVLSAAAYCLLVVVLDSISGFTSQQDHYAERIEERQREIRDQIRSWWPVEVEEKHPPDSVKESADAGESGTATASADRVEDASAETDETAGTESAESALLVTTQPAAADGPESGSSWRDLVYSQFDPQTVIALAGRLAGSIGLLLSNGLLIGLTVIFILLEVGSFPGKLSNAFSRRDDTTQQAEKIVSSVQQYMVIKTRMSLLTALLIAVWLKIFGVPYVALWALLAFLLNFIPNIGSIIAAVPAVLIAWLELSTLPAIGCAIGYIVVNVAIGNLLEPRVMGRGLGLSPLVIFCSMIFWGWVLGPVGMLLSVPLTMTAHIVLKGFDDTRWIAILMGTAGSAD